MSEPGNWSWKVADAATNARLHLRYEPGSWGDILKGDWAARLTRRLAKDAGPTFRYLDPFAGAPHYPLVPGARQRLDALGTTELFVQLQEPYIREERLASTALLVEGAAARAGACAELSVFDLDLERRSAWERRRHTRVLADSSGEAALGRATASGSAYDLILIDPYDFGSAWPQLLPLAVELAHRATVLIYLYNKSPRGGGHLRAYDALRRHLAKGLKRQPQTKALLGRLGADQVLPRAYHELLLLASAAQIETVATELEEAAVTFARRQAADGAFERF